ncbi:SDR family oxidoreductase [Natronocalculus amylovorans]|uniref:SDR family oxidoreductase n=1 Tax=Natronocalculus amylovorans TaxID=2917812 RepID=A0AAE3FZL2_9EURY|nr:SDR family oxidoreductase [Natronocalculus amylovorans]MCL9817805.1 SDR family oxidoreductase [Natronocalculus amylovorans]NUE03715.1 SDR family oxidoreductase [Halorubraceae archaeon YAN]
MNTQDRRTNGVVLITGASSGIGAETARRFAGSGMDVVLAARNEGSLAAVAKECEASGVDTLTVPTDVTDHEAVDALIDATLERFGQLDTAVVNAGIGETRDVPISDLPIEQFERVTETNVNGAYYTTQSVLPALRETGGSIVFVGSYKGKYPSTSTPVYAASKWWLRGFALSVAGQVGPDGVGVTLVNPSGVTTQFGSEYREHVNEVALDSATTLDASDVADAIVYAADQDPPATVTELDLNRRDIFDRF